MKQLIESIQIGSEEVGAVRGETEPVKPSEKTK